MKKKSKDKGKLAELYKRFINYFGNLDKKKRIILGVSVIVIIIAIVLCVIIINKNKNKNVTVVDNIPKAMYKEQKIDGLKFSDIEFDFKNNLFEYRVKVTNVSKEPKDFYGVAISLIKGKDETGRVELYNKTTIQPGESIIIKNFSTKNYTEADKLKYALIKEITE